MSFGETSLESQRVQGKRILKPFPCFAWPGTGFASRVRHAIVVSCCFQSLVTASALHANALRANGQDAQTCVFPLRNNTLRFVRKSDDKVMKDEEREQMRSDGLNLK